MPAAPILGPGLTTRKLIVQSKDVVYVKGILEASYGLAAVFAERGGELTLAAPESRGPELDGLIEDLRGELTFCIVAE